MFIPKKGFQNVIYVLTLKNTFVGMLFATVVIERIQLNTACNTKLSVLAYTMRKTTFMTQKGRNR